MKKFTICTFVLLFFVIFVGAEETEDPIEWRGYYLGSDYEDVMDKLESDPYYLGLISDDLTVAPPDFIEGPLKYINREYKFFNHNAILTMRFYENKLYFIMISVMKCTPESTHEVLSVLLDKFGDYTQSNIDFDIQGESFMSNITKSTDYICDWELNESTICFSFEKRDVEIYNNPESEDYSAYIYNLYKDTPMMMMLSYRNELLATQAHEYLEEYENNQNGL